MKCFSSRQELLEGVMRLRRRAIGAVCRERGPEGFALRNPEYPKGAVSSWTASSAA